MSQPSGTYIKQKELIDHLMEIFPEVSPNYLRYICYGKANTPTVLHELISKVILENNRDDQGQSTLKARDFEEQLEILKQILPDADPSYLEENCRELIDKPEELRKFMLRLIESPVYPTKKEYIRMQQLSSQKKFYTTEFDVYEFLKVIPDPRAYFEHLKKNPAKYRAKSHLYAERFLANRFYPVHMTYVQNALKRHDYGILGACKYLQKLRSGKHYMISYKKLYDLESIIVEDITLLQEIAFIEHREEIEAAVEARKAQEVEEQKQAKLAGILQTCSCCFDDEVMPNEIYECENGCIFCKNCVRRGSEVAFGDGKLEFFCLNTCSSFFSLRTLQAVLDSKMFSKVIQKKQLQEVKAAGIEDLEICPFCDFATIPPPGDKIFHCLNPECLRETCRLCKEPAHLPLRCEEVEKEEEVDIRTYIENKMTEALLRKCYKCGISFIKTEGCNKMTCSCGALMCYVCGKPVTNYQHFNGPGGDRFDLCPLYSDTNQLHEQAVLKGAEIAKKEKGLDLDPSKLKIDPTLGVQEYYKDVAKRNPTVVPPLGVAMALFGGQVSCILGIFEGVVLSITE
ncbi:hypothetical protein ILUMI_22126, partial [Ignelater luminosus]